MILSFDVIFDGVAEDEHMKISLQHLIKVMLKSDPAAQLKEYVSNHPNVRLNVSTSETSVDPSATLPLSNLQYLAPWWLAERSQLLVMPLFPPFHDPAIQERVDHVFASQNWEEDAVEEMEECPIYLLIIDDAERPLQVC